MPDANLTNEALTATLLQNLLAEADRIASDAHTLLSPMGDAREDLRAVLRRRGLIVPIADPGPPPLSIVAVDGGSVREPLYVADLMVVVAASAEGMTSVPGNDLASRHWCEIVRHTAENDRLIGAAMAAQELTLIDALTHDLRILDGSTTSTIVTLNAALNVRDSDLQDRVVDLITEEVLASIHALGSPQHRNHPGRVVALPKSDSTRYFLDDYHKDFGIDLPGGDRFMAAQVLNPGEMLYPRAAREHANVNLVAPKDLPEHVGHKAHQLAQAVAPIREAAATRRLVVTYIKPESADTVLKAELMVPEPLPDHTEPALTSAALDEVRLVARYLSDETPGPHMQEPFAQYAVDLAAKNVSVGASALNQSMLAHLPDGAESYLPLLARSYRTGGGGGGQARPGMGTPRPGGR